MFVSANQKKSTCKKPNCMYFSKSTYSCDYRLIAGRGRGMTVEDCTLYEKGDLLRPGQQHSRDNLLVSKNGTRKPKEKRVIDMSKNTETVQDPATDVNKNQESNKEQLKKKNNWSVIFKDIDAGMGVAEVSEKYGVTYAEIKQAKYRRDHTARKQAIKTEMAGSPPVQTPPTPATPAPIAQADTMKMNSKRDETIKGAFDRVTIVLAGTMPRDSVKIKAAALDLVHAIIAQASSEIGGNGI